MLGLGISLSHMEVRGWGAPSPAPSPTAPVLTLTDDTVNPPEFSFTTGDAAIDEDTLRLIHADNALFTGATTEDHLFVSDDVLEGTIVFPIFDAGFDGGDTIYWKMAIVRGGVVIATSNTLSAEIPEEPAAVLDFTVTATPANVNKGFSSASHTFAAQDVGAADVNRHVIVVIATKATDDALAAVNPVVIGGVNATLVCKPDARLWMYRAALPTGTTADVVVTLSATIDRIGVVVGRLITATPAPSDTDVINFGYYEGTVGTPHSITSTVPVDGLAIAAFTYETDSGAPAWSNATALANNQGQGLSILVAKNESDGAQAMTHTGFNYTGGSAAAASWSA